MPYNVTNYLENNKIGKIGKSRKILQVQTILLKGNEMNKCKPCVRVTIIHKNKNKL